MKFTLCIQPLIAAWLCGSALSATIVEKIRDVTVIFGQNDSMMIEFTCVLTASSRLHATLEWTHQSLNVSECVDILKLRAGSACTNATGRKNVLHLGKILRGESDGIYTCNQYWYPNNRKVLRYAANVSVIVIETTTPTNVSGIATNVTQDPNRTLSTDNNNAVIITGSIIGILIAGSVVSVAVVLVCRRRRSRYTLADADVITNISRSRSRRVQRTASNFTPWEFPRDKVRLVKELGEGFFSTAYEAQAYGITSPHVWTTVVVKMVRDDPEVETPSHASLLSEAKLLSDIGRCQHENVLRLMGISSSGGPLWLILEYAQHGDLRNYLRSMRNLSSDGQGCVIASGANASKEDIQLTEEKLFQFALPIARGMEHLTSRNILHRDLAARNVLVFDGEVLKICDFGMARDVRYVEYYRRRSPGFLPVKWTSPEAMRDKVHTQASDVWSYGIVLWEIVTLGGSPYPGVPVERLYDLLTAGRYHMSCPSNCPPRLYDVMLRCWAVVPSERPKFSALVQLIEDTLKEISEPPVSSGLETEQDKTQDAKDIESTL